MSVIVRKSELLVEKTSGKYKCPNFVPPSAIEELLASVHLGADEEATKTLAEVAENFALSLISSERNSITKNRILELVRSMELHD